MRGELRKGNSGHNSVPKSARRTEPSPRNPRFAAHLRCVSAKEGLGSQEGTGNHWCPVPFCLRRQTAAFPPVNTGTPGRRRRPLRRALRGRKVASSGVPLYRRKVYRQQTVKKKGSMSRWGTICKMFTFEPLTQDEKTAYIYIVIPKHCARCAALSRQRTGESICQQTRGRNPLKDR